MLTFASRRFGVYACAPAAHVARFAAHIAGLRPDRVFFTGRETGLLAPPPPPPMPARAAERMAVFLRVPPFGEDVLLWMLQAAELETPATEPEAPASGPEAPATEPEAKSSAPSKMKSPSAKSSSAEEAEAAKVLQPRAAPTSGPPAETTAVTSQAITLAVRPAGSPAPPPAGAGPESLVYLQRAAGRYLTAFLSARSLRRHGRQRRRWAAALRGAPAVPLDVASARNVFALLCAPGGPRHIAFLLDHGTAATFEKMDSFQSVQRGGGGPGRRPLS